MINLFKIQFEMFNFFTVTRSVLSRCCHMAPSSITHTIEKKPLLERMKDGYNPMTEGVRWSEKYDNTIERIWSRMPRVVSTTLATIAVFLLGTSMQGISYHFDILYDAWVTDFHDLD